MSFADIFPSPSTKPGSALRNVAFGIMLIDVSSKLLISMILVRSGFGFSPRGKVNVITKLTNLI